MQFQILQLSPAGEHLHGATHAQTQMAEFLPGFAGLNSAPTVFLLDLSKTISVTASYLRATLHWAFLCGQAHVQEKSGARTLDPWAVRPLPLFPAVTACSPEVTVDVDDFFRTRQLPLLHVTKRTETALLAGCLLGSLDSYLATTLQKLAGLREASAAQL